MISKGQSFISGILRVVNPLGKNNIFFSLLRFEIQKNYDFEILKFKVHSFIPLDLYVSGKDIQHMVEKQHQFFNLVHVIYERTFL